ncbi:MAG: hypothetical protein HDS21_03230 [Bacteroides sp.]|nr:hypothetical protein [Bacteroides sp.]
MDILREYYLPKSRTPFIRCSSETSPSVGDMVSLGGVQYQIISSKYDYEVWQSTGIFVYQCFVKQCQNDSLLQRIINQLSVQSPLLIDAVDIVNNAYPGDDVGGFEHDGNNYYLIIHKYLIDNGDDVLQFESELQNTYRVSSPFDLNCKGLDKVTFSLSRSLLKIQFNWNSMYVIPSQVFNRDGKVFALIQIVVPKGSSNEFDRFIKDAIHY